MSDTLGLDDMADIEPGQNLWARYSGLVVQGTADHVRSGAWFTKEGGLLVPPHPGIEWGVVPEPAPQLWVAPGTILAGRWAGAEVEVIMTSDGWADMNSGDPMPEDFELEPGWRTVAGRVVQA